MINCDKSALMMDKISQMMSREDLNLESLKKGLSADCAHSR